MEIRLRLPDLVADMLTRNNLACDGRAFAVEANEQPGTAGDAGNRFEDAHPFNSPASVAVVVRTALPWLRSNNPRTAANGSGYQQYSLLPEDLANAIECEARQMASLLCLDREPARRAGC